MSRHGSLVTLLVALLVAVTGCGPSNRDLAQEQNQATPRRVAAILIPDLEGGPERTGRPHEEPQPPPPNAFLSGDPKQKLVALTFDDGPDDNFTPKVLDVLKRHNVKATFFLVGQRAQVLPDLVKRMAREGHEVGNHTWSHLKMSDATPAAIRDQIRRTDQALRRLSGQRITLFRPPYGELDPKIMQEADNLKLKTVLWNVDSLDWKQDVNTEGVVRNVLGNARPGMIVLHHSAGGKGEDLTNTVEALPQIIQTLRSQGYRFVTVSELLATGNVVPGRF